MCGIFGSFKHTNYELLYDFNKQRGAFSYGHLFAKNEDGAMHIKKAEGIVELDLVESLQEDTDYDIFLGHTQAPTSSERDFSPQTSHPFEYGNWIVAHNGVLSNFEQLKIDHLPEWKCNVDSSVISALLHEYDTSYSGVELISHVLGMLEGTLGVWIYDKSGKKVYLARSGSTLFANLNTGDFSSIRVNDFTELRENTIYELDITGVEEWYRINITGTFEGKSPFFQE